jgi:hypothetical protein
LRHSPRTAKTYVDTEGDDVTTLQRPRRVFRLGVPQCVSVSRERSPSRGAEMVEGAQLVWREVVSDADDEPRLCVRSG